VNQQATVASQSKQVTAKVDAIEQRLAENKSPSQDLKDITRDVKNDVNQAAENPMKDATQAADDRVAAEVRSEESATKTSTARRSRRNRRQTTSSARSTG
jgi:hypothetical protein